MQTPLSILLKEKGYTIHSASPIESAYECAVTMSKMGVGALLVIEHDELKGIVSERDFLKKIVAMNSDPNTVPVAQVMTKDPITVPPSMTVQEAMCLMTEKRIRHLPVVENGKLLGIISIGDLTKWAMMQQEKEIAALTGYIHGV